jgi:L-alanine-DL-glutamate epimerase-like enolase superfamily enzyme
MIDNGMNRRGFLNALARGMAAAALPGSLAGSSFLSCGVGGGKDLEEILITRIERVLIEGKRPRIIGRNSRRGVHGQTVREPVVRLHTDSGLTGWGWSRVKADQAETLLGRKLGEVFDPKTGTKDEFLAFDFPLWDLAGRVLGKSVHKILGDKGDDPAPVYDGSIYIDDLHPETGKDIGIGPVLDNVGAGLDIGFRAFKVKIGRGHKWMESEAGFRRDVEVLGAIRNIVGPEVKIAVDANNGFTPEEARRLLQEAGDYNIFWFEEPFPEKLEDCVSYKRFIADGGWGTLLADGEGSDRREAEFTEIVQAGGIDVVQFDMRGYSLTKWLAYLRVIEEMEILTAPHNWGSHLSGFYIAQFGRGCRHFCMGEIDTMEMPGVTANGYKLRNGMMTFPDTTGFGLELDPELVEHNLNGEDGWVVGKA